MDFKSPLGHTDIYLIDQILKNRYQPTDKILDAGVGSGRNLSWFIERQMNFHAVDRDKQVVEKLQRLYPHVADRFVVADLSNTPFFDSYFNHIICNAVLHFCDGHEEFLRCLRELYRVLKENGSLFFRMASNIGIESRIRRLGQGVYDIPDGSQRYLLTRDMVKEILDRFGFELIEPLKTTNVNDLRCMSTLVLQKIS